MAANNAPEETPVPEHIEALSEAEKGVLEKLKTLDDQYLAMEKEYEVELAELQSKFEKKWFPLLDQRAEKLKAGDTATGVGTPAIKSFWLTALKNTENFREVIEEHDEPVLESLENIKYEWLDPQGKTGWKLHFHFAENEFFTNKVLTKTFHTQQVNQWDTSLEYTKIELLEPINWKPGKDVTVEVVQKKVKGGGKKKQKAKAKQETVPRPSWFRIFRNLGEGFELPEELDEEEEDDEDDEEMDKMDMYLQEDAEDSEALRDQIIPHAVRYYTGEAGPGEDSDDEDEDDDDDDEDDDDDDDDDDDESDDEPAKGKGKKPSPKKKGGSPRKDGGQPQQECKQS
jgi:nucleosome assembly protein 1-like 1